MNIKQSDFHNRSIEKVKHLWHLYILGEDSEKLEMELGKLSEQLLMIGTGMHEFYQTRDEFLTGMSRDQIEARDIQFELQDEWYEVKEIGETVCVVYGSIWAREKVLPGQTVFVDMQDSRFTMVCRDTKEGVEIVTIHHSMPYVDQGSDEYYPKTLSHLAKELEHKAELDHMTGFYSNYYMANHVSQAMKDTNGYFLVLDLDDFKQINDTQGHLKGDQVLKEFANILRKIASPHAILGRMGGDEFAVWDPDIHSKSEIELKFVELLEACHEMSARLGVQVTCSSGVVFARAGMEEFKSLYYRTDQALYRAKFQGKKQLYWADRA